MHQTHDLFFRQFRLDVANERLWQRSQEVTLRPKTFAVLRYLLEHADRLVTKQELLDAVWPDTAVSDVVPLVCIRELRKALNDEAGTPRFIETVPRRGYRFIAHVTHTPPIKSQRPTIKSRSLATSEAFLSPPPVFVGRETELGQLHEWLTRATVGDRQIIFISGESGIGKTALIEEFLRSASARQPLWIARGQCIEHYGAGEAYLPVLDALGRLYREMDGARLLEILQRYAPTWLGQMPSFLPEIDFDSLRGRIQGASRERMLREMAEAIEVLTGDSTTLELPVLVLWIEDLHWSDASTLDLLSFLARRQERARLLVLGTYRPAEVLVRKHPLLAMKQELQLHERSKELHLNLLSEQAVAEYLQQRGERELPQAFSLYALAGKIHRRTSGNPLFMVTLVSQLLGQCGASPLGSKLQAVEEFLHVIPETLRQMVEQQVSRLSPKEQHLLEIASVAGSEFSAATVAVGLGEEITGCEKCCEELARCGQFLRTRGVEEWPDGTLAGRYGFVHALYRDVLYDRLTASQRMELHRRIGERKEIAYGTKAKTIAAELAVHFAQGRDYYRAVRYLQKAAGNAVDCHAFQEAIEHVAKGLELLHKWPAVSERAQQELLLHMSVVGPLMATKGEAAPEVEHAYAQIWALHQQLGERAQPFMVVLGYWVISIGRGEVRKARELAAQLMEMAQVKKNPLLSLWAHHALGVSLFHGGAPVEAHAALEEVETLYNTQQHPRYMFDPKLACLSFQALVRWTLGYPQQALGRSRAAEICAQRASHPYGFAFVLTAAAWLYENRREGNLAQQRAAALITLAQEHGFVQYETLGMLLQGGICVTQGAYEEGIRLLRQGLEARRGTSMELGASAWLVLLATAYLHTGQISEGHAALSEAEAVIQRTGECFYEAELYRIKGELLLQQAKTDN